MNVLWRRPSQFVEDLVATEEQPWNWNNGLKIDKGGNRRSQKELVWECEGMAIEKKETRQRNGIPRKRRRRIWRTQYTEVLNGHLIYWIHTGHFTLCCALAAGELEIRMKQIITLSFAFHSSVGYCVLLYYRITNINFKPGTRKNPYSPYHLNMKQKNIPQFKAIKRHDNYDNRTSYDARKMTTTRRQLNQAIQLMLD